MMDWHWGWGTMMFGGIGMLLLWGLLIALVILGVRSFTGTPENRSAGDRGEDRAGGRPSTPLEVVQRRYAAGEISREEYEQIYQDLTRPAPR